MTINFRLYREALSVPADKMALMHIDMLEKTAGSACKECFIQRVRVIAKHADAADDGKGLTRVLTMSS